MPPVRHKQRLFAATSCHPLYAEATERICQVPGSACRFSVSLKHNVFFVLFVFVFFRTYRCTQEKKTSTFGNTPSVL